MKERPILFSAPMVRALLNGSKTQTRRVAKLTSNGHVKEPGGNRRWHTADFDARLACPYGQPGERLWVREAWRAPSSCDHLPPRSISDSEGVRFMAEEIFGADPGFGKGRPGMFMPRRASRITLEITSVRLERLQDISEDDALAEGCSSTAIAHEDGEDYTGHYASEEYQDLWESINGPGSWGANPFVWVVEFRKI